MAIAPAIGLVWSRLSDSRFFFVGGVQCRSMHNTEDTRRKVTCKRPDCLNRRKKIGMTNGAFVVAWSVDQDGMLIEGLCSYCGETHIQIVPWILLDQLRSSIV